MKNFLLVFVLFAIVHNSLTNKDVEKACYASLEVDPLFIHIHEGESFNVTVNVTSSCTHVEKVAISSTDDTIFFILDKTDTNQLFANSSEYMMIIISTGVKLGIAKLVINVVLDDGLTIDSELFVKVKRKDSLMKQIFDILLIIWMIVTYVTMGVKIDVRVLWNRMKKPLEVGIGAICQFIIMPALAFGLAKALRLDNISAIGLVTDGSCPGGWLSNMLSLLLNIDFALSLTMTTVSTILAIGTMPLNLFIYARPFIPEDDIEIKIPYKIIVIQLVLLIAPIVIGVLIRLKSDKLTKICEKLLRPFATLLIVVALGFGIPSELYVFYSPWEIYTAAVLLPMLGATLGLAFSKVTRMDTKTAATIALETGVQNGLLAKALITMSFPNPEADLMARLPLLIALLTLMEGLVVALFKIIWERFFKSKAKLQNEEHVRAIDDKDNSFDNIGMNSENIEVCKISGFT